MNTVIHVGKFPINNGFEYRVTHKMCIDYNVSDDMFDILQVLFFGDSISFDNELDAWKAALVLNNEVKANGIMQTTFKRPIISMSFEDAKLAWEDYWYKI